MNRVKREYSCSITLHGTIDIIACLAQNPSLVSSDSEYPIICNKATSNPLSPILTLLLKSANYGSNNTFFTSCDSFHLVQYLSLG